MRNSDSLLTLLNSTTILKLDTNIIWQNFKNRKLLISPEVGGWAVLNRTAENLVKRLSENANYSDMCCEYGVEDTRRCLQTLYTAGLLEIDGYRREPKKTVASNHGLKYLILKLTRACNLRCRYCYMGTPQLRNIDTQTAFLAIKKALLCCSDRLTVLFHGGEPLLQMKLIMELVDLVETLLPKDRDRIDFNVQTNGTLICDNIVQFFRSHRIGVCVSIDGYLDAHNAFRVYTNGTPATQKILEGVYRLLDSKVPVSISPVISCANVNYLPIIVRFFMDKGVRNIAFLNPKKPSVDGRSIVDSEKLFFAMSQVVDFLIGVNQGVTRLM